MTDSLEPASENTDTESQRCQTSGHLLTDAEAERREGFSNVFGERVEDGVGTISWSTDGEAELSSESVCMAPCEEPLASFRESVEGAGGFLNVAPSIPTNTNLLPNSNPLLEHDDFNNDDSLFHLLDTSTTHFRPALELDGEFQGALTHANSLALEALPRLSPLSKVSSGTPSTTLPASDDFASETPASSTSPAPTSQPSKLPLMPRLKPSLSCSQCPEVFQSTGSLRAHQRIHKATFACTLGCGKRFPLEKDRDRHELDVHHGVNPMCSMCGKQFRKDNLKRHVPKCKGPRPRPRPTPVSRIGKRKRTQQ